MTEHSRDKQPKSFLDGLEKEEYIQVNREADPHQLARFDLHKRITHQGKHLYVLFHKGGNPPAREIPGAVYVRSTVLDELIRLVPDARALETAREDSERESLENNIFYLLLRGQFQQAILDSNEFNLQKKIELTVGCANEVMRKVFDGRQFDRDNLELVMRVGDTICYLIELIFQDNKALNMLLGEIIGEDYRLYSHCVGVSLYSGLLFLELGNGSLHNHDSEDLKQLVAGSLLHDVGKTLIDPRIIDKVSPLSAKEFEEIKRHPVYGIKLVEKEELSETILDIIAQHHEKWTGGGYPAGLSYQQINGIARIASIGDVFDALTTRKPYRPSLKPFEALLLMKQQMIGKFYHPYLNAFIKFLGRGA